MGADTERVYTLFIGPRRRRRRSGSDEAVIGAWRFLQRVWRMPERLPEAPPTAPRMPIWIASGMRRSSG